MPVKRFLGGRNVCSTDVQELLCGPSDLLSYIESLALHKRTLEASFRAKLLSSIFLNGGQYLLIEKVASLSEITILASDIGDSAQLKYASKILARTIVKHLPRNSIHDVPYTSPRVIRSQIQTAHVHVHSRANEKYVDQQQVSSYSTPIYVSQQPQFIKDNFPDTSSNKQRRLPSLKNGITLSPLHTSWYQNYHNYETSVKIVVTYMLFVHTILYVLTNTIN